MYRNDPFTLIFVLPPCNFQDLVDSSVKLGVADNTPHTPQGIGYLHIPAGTELGYLDVKCYWTPTMPVTILSPDAIGTQFKCCGYSIRNDFWGLACTVTFHHRLCQSQDILLTLSYCHGLLFTASFLPLLMLNVLLQSLALNFMLLRVSMPGRETVWNQGGH
jgi:hypothetical protein